MQSNRTDYLIIGAGVSGLACATALAANNRNCVVLERSATAGGMVQSCNYDGWRFERGANSTLARPAFMRLVRQLGIEDRLVRASARAKKRYLVKDDVLFPLPMRARQWLRSPLLSRMEKLRALCEPMRPIQEPPGSIERFFTHRLGGAFCRRIVDPFVSGIWAGDVSRLQMEEAFPAVSQAVRRHGSLLGWLRAQPGGLPEIVSFDRGMGVLVEAMAARLQGQLHLHQRIRQLRFSPGGWRVITNDREWCADRLILAVPVAALPSLLPELPAALRGHIDGSAHAPIMSCALGYRTADVGHDLDGYGMLIPRCEERKTLGVIFSSTIFPGRCPKDKTLLTAFIGGRHNPLSPDGNSRELEEMVVHDVRCLLSVTASPVFIHSTVWHPGIPQYEAGHRSLRAAVQSYCQARNVDVCSSFSGGVSIADRVDSALALVDRLCTS